MGLVTLRKVLSLTAAGRCLILKSNKPLNCSFSQAKMSKGETWEVAKEKYLNMDPEEKRKSYRTKKYFRIQDIATWPEYCQQNSPLLENLPMLVEHKIDPTKNSQLVDKISIFLGDITQLEVDAIVNAANASLLGGGGVDGAIHRAAGHLLKEECRTLRGCKVGEALITGGYKLPAKYVIHTVGPQGEKPDKLKECYKNSLNVALGKGISTIAFPCISTGIYGYPLEPAAHIAAMEVRRVLEENPDKFSRVIFCLFAEIDENIYQRILQTYFPLK